MELQSQIQLNLNLLFFLGEDKYRGLTDVFYDLRVMNFQGPTTSPVSISGKIEKWK